MQLRLNCDNCKKELEVTADASMGAVSFPCPACGVSLQMPHTILERGQTIDGFRIEKHLGSGSMGSVYLANQLSMDRQVAVKVLPADHRLPQGAADDFLREIRHLAKLDHPNIVGAIEAGFADDHYYFAMRHISGETLEDRIDRLGKLDEKSAIRIVTEMAKALKCAWQEHGMLHRDIKPANIMLDRDDRPILLDLGIAKVYGAESKNSAAGVIVGTPYYMSPEQAVDSRTVDFKADIYSLGCTMFHALTGDVPYDAPDPIGVLTKHKLAPVGPHLFARNLPVMRRPGTPDDGQAAREASLLLVGPHRPHPERCSRSRQ